MVPGAFLLQPRCDPFGATFFALKGSSKWILCGFMRKWHAEVPESDVIYSVSRARGSRTFLPSSSKSTAILQVLCVFPTSVVPAQRRSEGLHKALVWQPFLGTGSSRGRSCRTLIILVDFDPFGGALSAEMCCGPFGATFFCFKNTFQMDSRWGVPSPGDADSKKVL